MKNKHHVKQSKNLKDKKANELTDDEALYLRITSAKSRQAADGLFAATPEELGKTYQPGRTETE